MNEDCLKLTTYFGERDRTADGLLADELLDIYGGHRLQASILLRGAEGFGRLHHLHTDRLLTLSEDLPVVSIAVDRRERIEAMLEPILQIKRRGLITLERARLLSGEIGPVQLPEELGEATKLTVYVGRQERVDRTPAFAAVCDLLYRRGIAGASVLLGVDGTRRGRRVRARFFGRNADVPMMIIAVGSGEQIAAVLPELGGLLHEPLMTLERVRVCKRDGELLADAARAARHRRARSRDVAEADDLHLAQRHPRRAPAAPARSSAACANPTPPARPACAASGAFTATTPRTATSSSRSAATSRSARSSIDTPERIAESFEIIDELTAEHGLVTSEMVPAMTAMSETETHGGLRLADHEF